MKTEFKKIVFSVAVVFCASCIAFADWDPGDPNKMHFPQMPDPQGWDICLHEQMIADDFQCTETGPITDIHFWVSWMANEAEWPSTTFTVQIWSSVLGGPCGGGMPGTMLWSWNSAGGIGNFVVREPPYVGLQGWHCPLTLQNIYPDHTNYWQINITGIPVNEAFHQTEGQIYWLVIRAQKPLWPPAVGWKTSLNRFGSCSLWSTGGVAVWQPVKIYNEMTVDQAFVITNDGGMQEGLDFGDAPDQPYPTLLANNGARHNIVAGMFLGAAIDGEPDGQPTAPADGDDLAGVPDDEDGITFNTPLIAGQNANVTIIASQPGFLDAWIDFNGDGIWTMGLPEQIATALPLTAGVNTLNFTVPASAITGQNLRSLQIQHGRRAIAERTCTRWRSRGLLCDYRRRDNTRPEYKICSVAGHNTNRN
jgi:hypothetical protein